MLHVALLCLIVFCCSAQPMSVYWSQVTQQMLDARPLFGSTHMQWAQYVTSVDGLPRQIRMLILARLVPHS